MVEKNKKAFLWLAAGILLSIMVLVTVLSGLKGDVYIADAEGIAGTADRILSSMKNREWDRLSQLVSGNPELVPETGGEGTAEKLLWDAYLDSLQWELSEGFAVRGERVIQSASVKCMDISAVADRISQLQLAAPDTEQTQEREAYLYYAAQLALEADVPTIEKTIAMTFQRENGHWQMVPDNALLALLSGFTAP